MILPDINLLVHAYNRQAPRHAQARVWWEGLLNGSRTVGVPWAVVFGFVRLMTHPAVLVQPLGPEQAIHHVRSWLDRPVVQIAEPGPRHLDIFESLLRAVGVAGNLTTDAHLAAIAIEYQYELHSNDTDFARFPGLRWRDPL